MQFCGKDCIGLRVHVCPTFIKHASQFGLQVSVLTIFIDEVNTCLKIKRVLKMQYEASFVPRPNKPAMADVWQKFSTVFEK